MNYKRRLVFLARMAAALLLPGAAGCATHSTSSPPEPSSPLAGWTTTRGGDEGRVITVDTLAADGPGSLAAAIAAEGPRKVVFKVAGVIDLSGRSLRVRQPHLTIAGETAPSPGITLIRGGVGISTHDVVIRHLRVRPGEAGRGKGSGWDVDGIATSGGAHDVVIDHCSVSWSTDENLTASGPRFQGKSIEEWRRNTSHRITFSHCLIAEGLRLSTHSKGTPHSMGSLIHDNTSDIAIVGNLYISNGARNPLFKGGARGAVVNNLIHNPGGSAISFGLVPVEWEGHDWVRGAMVIVGNVTRKGPDTPAQLNAIRFGSVWGVAECDAFIKDNLLFDADGKPLPLKPAGDYRALPEAPFWPPRLQARPSGEVAAWVLANVGARPWDRDVVDRRLVEEARAGKGKIIDSEREVGGYEILTAGNARPQQ
ncbi:MAG: pectate lyase [Verrucomicrobiota bacterium]